MRRNSSSVRSERSAVDDDATPKRANSSRPRRRACKEEEEEDDDDSSKHSSLVRRMRDRWSIVKKGGGKGRLSHARVQLRAKEGGGGDGERRDEWSRGGADERVSNSSSQVIARSTKPKPRAKPNSTDLLSSQRRVDCHVGRCDAPSQQGLLHADRIAFEHRRSSHQQ